MIGDGCFAVGSAVATDGGTTPVESLTPGQTVQTATGAATLTAIEPLAPGAGAAILLHPGSLGPARPARKLLVSPEQLLLIEDAGLPQPVLVPAGALVNGRGVERTARPATLTWFALSFAAHCLPLVEGQPAGCKREPSQPLSARLLPPGPGLFALRSRLARAAAPAGAVEPRSPPAAGPPPPRDAPALLLLADGQPVSGTEAGNDWHFTIPPRAARLHLVSPVGHALEPDGREYGVAVRALLLDGIPLTLCGPAAGAGFHPPEGDATHTWRWTTGRATLALPPCATPRRLTVTITDWHTRLQPAVRHADQ